MIAGGGGGGNRPAMRMAGFQARVTYQRLAAAVMTRGICSPQLRTRQGRHRGGGAGMRPVRGAGDVEPGDGLGP